MKGTILTMGLLCLIACGPNGNQHKIVIRKDKDGHILSETHVAFDSVRDGVEKKFNKNGTIKSEIEYSNGVRHGWDKRYDGQGKISSQGQFENGLENGVRYEYYDNGNLQSEGFWLNGKAFGNTIFYYRNGKPRLFNCYDFDEHNRYLIKYDTNGSIKIEDGDVLGQILINGREERETIQKSLIAIGSVATPPRRTVKVYVREFGSKTLTSLPIQHNQINYTHTFSTVGNIRLTFIAEMFEASGQLMKKDSIVKDLIVEDNIHR